MCGHRSEKLRASCSTARPDNRKRLPKKNREKERRRLLVTPESPGKPGSEERPTGTLATKATQRGAKIRKLGEWGEEKRDQKWRTQPNMRKDRDRRGWKLLEGEKKTGERKPGQDT